ncbi:hypothetical protein HII12_000390 [Brettanomyces bruxellensis]|uniref:Gfd2/YDR514C-like C-terminal domain-containing protein n=1 Tax=Dekkera bruxellensis TaxID=5007 RepID=A0A8H6EZN1_DEKBR|nr:hypothetical protein HII12_000390 [Brettanomyces bruxellensis]
MLRIWRISQPIHFVKLFRLNYLLLSPANSHYNKVIKSAHYQYPRSLSSNTHISLDSKENQFSVDDSAVVKSTINTESLLNVVSVDELSVPGKSMRKIQKGSNKAKTLRNRKSINRKVLKVLKAGVTHNLGDNNSQRVLDSSKASSQNMNSSRKCIDAPVHPVEDDKVLTADESTSLVQLREFNLLSIDIEMYERKTSEITEIGISIYNPRYQKTALFPHIVCFHLIIKEFIKHRNGRFVPDAKGNNITGVSTIVTMSEAKKMVGTLLNKLGPKTVIVGHGVQGDLRLLRKHNFPFPKPIRIIDTQKLWNYMYVGKNHKSSLSYVLNKLGIPHSFLHNGANDSYFTLIASLMLCSPGLMSNIITRKTVPCQISDHKKKLLQEEGVELPMETIVTVKCGTSEADIKAKKGHGHVAKSNSFYPWHDYNKKELDQRLDELLKN